MGMNICCKLCSIVQIFSISLSFTEVYNTLNLGTTIVQMKSMELQEFLRTPTVTGSVGTILKLIILFTLILKHCIKDKFCECDVECCGVHLFCNCIAAEILTVILDLFYTWTQGGCDTIYYSMGLSFFIIPIAFIARLCSSCCCSGNSAKY
uniref:uncharacterized protein LOC120338456 n=1 Tax=Styela clava TaxID=7725 RepID=UPI00193A0200|nr:uncharacterized protein LOC120338456 [Styela clava]